MLRLAHSRIFSRSQPIGDHKLAKKSHLCIYHAAGNFKWLGVRVASRSRVSSVQAKGHMRNIRAPESRRACARLKHKGALIGVRGGGCGVLSGCNLSDGRILGFSLPPLATGNGQRETVHLCAMPVLQVTIRRARSSVLAACTNGEIPRDFGPHTIPFALCQATSPLRHPRVKSRKI